MKPHPASTRRKPAPMPAGAELEARAADLARLLSALANPRRVC
jgi:hypothetical protein